MEKVLIIEDDRDIAQLMSIHLQDMNFETEHSYDGKEGLLKAMNNEYKLILLDIRLPGMDGIDICRKIRQEKIDTPIIMVTSKSEEIDKILGLELGADDYITKPFSIRELIARVKAVLRRMETVQHRVDSVEEQKIIFDDFLIDVNKRIVEVNKNRPELTPKEFDLLVLLASNPGKTYSRLQLLDKVWGYDFEGFEHTVNTHINRLRSKIEKDPNQPEFILTTWGVGYRFMDDETLNN
ncbi:MAG: response regulator transcription factor [Bacteroidales bacterium]|nr:response regulator transcription factor [Bacteroidales bacterium]MCF8455674.1 response regulator transcription factor [Bacteroidales bacterium]